MYKRQAQRQATNDAAKLANINVLRLINEPTAAAVAYGLDKKVEGYFVIFDLGGGTFDISILHLTKGLFEVIATHGNSQLGGDDFDNAILNWLVKNHNLNTININHKQSLKTLSRKIKEQLTTNESVEIDYKLNNKIHLKNKIDRKTFSELTLDLTKKTIDAIKHAMKDAN